MSAAGLPNVADYDEACKEGEVAAAWAAGRAGPRAALAGLSTIAMEDVFAEAISPKWFQLYIYKDRGVTRELAQEAMLLCGFEKVAQIDGSILEP